MCSDGWTVERNLRTAVGALETMDSSVMVSIEQTEQINAFEILVDREVMNIIALRQPAAGDLRVVITFLRSYAT